jgi:putative membrane-bound dehydrogenase-like protein
MKTTRILTAPRCLVFAAALITIAWLVGTATPTLRAADKASDTAPPSLKEVKIPDLFEATIFATPPQVNYPVFVSAAPDGTLYVSSDKNGSLGRDPHRGSIVRLRDTKGDGVADESKKFVPDVDSPRGLVWDHDRLYLVHPPHLSVFIDKDGDGVADEEKILVKNCAFTFKDRPADHTTNGLELGVDGWLYISQGDFGFMQAEGTDGRKMQMRGGGVWRVRPDGTGMELYAYGTRNVVEAPVSPLLDIFARDNTNDGGGWDTRFHHFTGLENHGYPRLFKNFSDEIVARIADYGGGGACGAAWIDEPGMPAGWNNTVYTADWGRSWIYMHHLKPKGATFDIDQTEFLGMTRTTDLDVDGLTHIYAASWKGAVFNYAGENVGFIVRVSPKGYKPEPLPDFEKASDAGLVKLLESPSHRRRLEAQRTLLRRGLKPETVSALTALAADKSKTLETRVVALFAIKQGLGAKSADTLARLTADPAIRAWAIRALTDRWDELANVPAAPILAGLKDADARVRKEAAVSVARLGKSENAAAVAPLLADADPVVAHTAVQALVRLDAANACFAVVDNPSAPAAQRTGALHALQLLHKPPVVDGLIARLGKERDSARRRGLITALCRLHDTEGQWKGDSWGTRPDTRGPYYQPEAWAETQKIDDVLKNEIAKASGDEAAFLVAEFSRHRINPGDATGKIIELAAKDPSLIPSATAQLARVETVPMSAVPILIKAATDDASNDLVRANAIIALAKTDSADGFRAILAGLPKIKGNQGVGPEVEKARESLFNSPKTENHHQMIEDVAAKMQGKESLWADAALLNLAGKKIGAPEPREMANKALDAGWADPKRRAQIISATALSHTHYRVAQLIAALDDPNKEVANAAHSAIRALKIDPEKFKASAQSKSPLISTMKVDAAIAAVVKEKGDPSAGQQLFTQQGCIACHTVNPKDPPKGPFLGNIATIYKRPELAEAVLLPNKTIAQGFTTNAFDLKNGDHLEGFVTQEAADKVSVRNLTGEEVQIPVANIAKRYKLDRSMMPEGLVSNLTIHDFASLLDYLESMKVK